MTMKPRHKRTAMIVGALAALSLAAYFVLNAFQSNLVFFFTPSQVGAGEAPQNRTFRVGGLVKEGSVKRDNLTVAFIVTDSIKEVPVSLHRHPAGSVPRRQRRGGAGATRHRRQVHRL